MTGAFTLDPTLKKDTFLVAQWPVSQVLLMNDRQYPWCILVPARVGLSELYQLTDSDSQQLQRESMALSRWMMHEFSGFKLNVAALGNVVRQLHIHHVVRFEGDPAWPAPIWGKLPAKHYDDVSLQAMMGRLEPLKTMFL